MQHFIDIKQLSRSAIEDLINKANSLLQQSYAASEDCCKLNMANLFFEPSTRTALSFQTAAQRLRIPCLTPDMRSSSLSKGETLLDTIQTIAAMGVNVFVVRHGENGIMSWLAERMPPHSHLLNAGEGWLQHPTQTLLDLMTIKQHLACWEKLSIAIIGDLRHSRVARSLVDGLKIMGVSDIRLIAPPVLQPEQDMLENTPLITDLATGIENVDAMVCLRLQKERMSQGQLINETEFYEQYGLTKQQLARAKPNAIVLHPGPINRNIEISSEVADGEQSVILQQVTNGVAMRMAVLTRFASQYE